MLKISHLSYKYSKSLTITFPDFSIEKNGVLLVKGSSGCGKTTLLHLLAGLLTPLTGEIHVNDHRFSSLNQPQKDRFRGKNIGIIFQKSYFIDSLSLLENLVLSPFARDKNKAIEIANRLNIKELLFKKPYQLSEGQQQRVSIARALMNNPKLILADEPTSALDDENCEKVLNLLLQEAKNNHAMLIIVTHDNRLNNKVKNCIELKNK